MDHEARINAALGKILRNYNALELNLGLCLRQLENPDDPGVSHTYLYRHGMPQVIKKLSNLLAACEHIPDTRAFQQWMTQADEIRRLRNYYVHAAWEYLPRRKEVPLGFRIPPWRKESIRGRQQGTLRLADLEADADRIEQALNEFMANRKQYGV